MLTSEGSSLFFSESSPAIRRYAGALEANVLSKLDTKYRILHVGLADTREIAALGRRGSRSLGRVVVLAHDPPDVAGLPDWRPKRMALEYVAWRARAVAAQRKAQSILKAFDFVATTSASAAKAFSYGFAGHLGAMDVGGVLDHAARMGVLGHLTPSRDQSSLFPVIAASSLEWDMVGRCDDEEYLAGLRKAAPKNLTLHVNVSKQRLLELRSHWAAMVMPPSRSNVWSASQAVVDCLASGIPVAYPEKSSVLAEYVGRGGISYIHTESLASISSLAVRNNVTLRERASEQGARFRWDEIRDQWKGYLLALP